MLEDPLFEEPEIGLLAGVSYWSGMCIGHILGSTCGGCGKRRGGAIPVMSAHGEAILVMGAFGGPLRRTARSACPGFLWTYVVSEICRTFRTLHLPTVMVDPV